MIDDTLWDLKEPQVEHPGIVLSLDPHVFPVVTVFCSGTDIGEDGDEVFMDAPVPPFGRGTRIYFRKTRLFEPKQFSGNDPKIRYQSQLSAQDLTAIQAEYMGLYNARMLVGKSKL